VSRLPVQGEYLASLITRKDGTTYTAYFRVLKDLDPIENVVQFVDDTGARVTMSPVLVFNMRRLYKNEKHPEINLEPWQ
jgi:hypothetical protein